MINIPNDKNLSLHNYYSNHSSSTQSKSILYSSHHRKWKKNPSQVFKNTSVDNTTPIDNTLNHIILTDGSRSISRDNENACRSRRSVITSRAPYIPPPWTKQPRITRKIGFRPRGSRRAVEHVIGNVESISLLLGATLGYIEGVNIFARHV